MKYKFLVLYDYGQGGRWALVLARNASEINACFPELTIESQRPGWMSDEYYARLEAGLDDLDEPRGLLADILKGRE